MCSWEYIIYFLPPPFTLYSRLLRVRGELTAAHDYLGLYLATATVTTSTTLVAYESMFQKASRNLCNCEFSVDSK